MAFEQYSVFTKFEFQSNAKAVLGDIAKLSGVANKEMRALKATFDVVNTAAARVDKTIAALTKTFSKAIVENDRMIGANARLEASFGATGARALLMGDEIVDGGRVASAGIRSAAMQTAAYTRTMRAEFAATAAAARGMGATIGGSAVRAGAGGSGAAIAAGTGGMMGALRTGGSLAALATIAGGVKGAGDLQNSALQVAIATGNMGPTLDATLRNMSGMTNTAYVMSGMTGGSVNNMMTVLQQAATSGLSQKQLNRIAKPLAQFTDVMHFNTKENMGFGEAATMGSSMAHDMRMFSADDTKYLFGRAAEASYQSPHKMSQIYTQIRRFAPQFENMLGGSKRQKADQIFNVATLIDRLGNLQFGGSGVNALASYLMNPRTGKQKDALFDLGVNRANGSSRFLNQRTGEYDFFGAIEQVSKRFENALNRPGGRAQVNRDIGQLPINVARMLTALMSQDAVTAFGQTRAQSRRMGDPVHFLDVVQTQVMETLPHAFLRLVTNIETLATTIGEPLVKPITHLISNLATAVGEFAMFLKGHRGALLAVTAGTTVAAGFGAMKLLELVGGVSAFAHMAAHKAGHELGIGARIYTGHGADGFGRAPGGGILKGLRGLLFDVFGFNATRGIFSAGAAKFGATGFGQGLGGVAKMLGADVLSLLTPLRIVGEGFFRLGLRAIPLIGELLLLVDVFKFVSKHADVIGKTIGHAAHWVVKHGAPLIFDAFVAVVRYIVDGLKATIGGALLHGFHGGIWDVGRNVGGNVREAWMQDDDRDAGRPARRPGDNHERALKPNQVVRGSNGSTTTLTVQNMNVHPSKGQDLKGLIEDGFRHLQRNSVPKKHPLIPTQGPDPMFPL